jgi:cell division septation protein DedD
VTTSTAAAKSVARPVTVKPKPAAATKPKPAAVRSRFGLSVATFLNEDRAIEERGRLASSTGLAARVVPVHQDDDSVSSYSIVIGAYPSRDAAERAASNLIQRGLVDEARVVAAGAPAPKR